MGKKVNILLFLHAPRAGGAERFMLNLINNLSRNLFNITFVLFNKEGEYAHLIPRDINVIELGMQVPGPHQLTNPYWILKVMRIIKAARPDIIFAPLNYTNLMTITAGRLSRTRAKIIIREAGIISKFLELDTWYLFKKLVYQICYSRADIIVAPSGAILKDIKDNLQVNIRNSCVIPNFVDSGFINERLNSSLDYELSGLPIVISVGRLEYVKGMDIGIRAVKKAQEYCLCDYWIIGDGSQMGRLKKLSRELGIEKRVRFWGYQENPYQFLKQASVFLLPSRSEGFPNALLEAMYCGLPGVVAYYNESVSDFVQDGNGVLLAPNEDYSGIADALRQLLTNEELHRRISQKARERALCFTKDAVMEKYEALFLNSVTL